MSLGGVLGGAFSGLLAPVIFPTVVEYPLLIAAALFCVPLLTGDVRALRGHLPAVAFAVAGGLLMQAAAHVFPGRLSSGVRP